MQNARNAPFSAQNFRTRSKSEDAHFFVRTLEKGAHLRRKHRDFPRCALFESGAHLRRRCAPSNQGTALDPVPLMRKVAQRLASASILLLDSFLREVSFIHHRIWEGGADLAVASACGSAIGTDFERPGRTETKKAVALDSGTAPQRRDLQLSAVPYFDRYYLDHIRGGRVVQDQNLFSTSREELSEPRCDCRENAQKRKPHNGGLELTLRQGIEGRLRGEIG